MLLVLGEAGRLIDEHGPEIPLEAVRQRADQILIGENARHAGAIAPASLVLDQCPNLLRIRTTVPRPPAALAEASTVL
jgi:hypothetical protein